MAEEKVFFEGEFGKICGVLHKIDETSEIVIIVHGFSSTKNSSALQISQLLNEIGLNTLRIDLDNQGESDLDFKLGVSIPNYVKQVGVAIGYCKNLGYKEISLVGTSFGGITTFATAMSHPEIKRMILRCPVVDYQKHILRKFGKEKVEMYLEKGEFPLINKEGKLNWFNSNCYLSAKDYSMFDHAKNLKMPILIIQGDKDEAVEWELTKEIIGLFPNARLHIIEGAKHSLAVDGDFSENLNAIRNFFKE